MPAGSILVADDDAAIRTVLNQALSRAGYEVRSTSNAATLWRWVSQGEGDLVITDVVMPDENAFDLLPRIKKLRPELPVIIMSAQNPFVAINMAAIPRDLIESELFGHEKGASTGANTRSSGRFEQAEGGTLFLDEIGDMPMEAQTRLLRVLQQGEYTTVGGRTPIKADVRIIAATNKDLRILIQQGLFREDLFFRLNVVPLRLPPLRERTEDVADLIRHFFALVEREGLPGKQLEPAAYERLKHHRWPGNVRELENLARRLAALYPQETISAAVVDAELSQPAMVSTNDEPRSEEGLSSAVERHLTSYFASFGDGLPPPGLYYRVLREIEHPLLSVTLAATRGNQIRAADLLGVNRNTLRKKIRDLDIQVFRSSG